MHDEERLRPARQAGLRADRTRIPELVAILQEKPTPIRFLMETALLPLAQLGATDALPAINALILGGRDKDGKDLVEPNIINAARAPVPGSSPKPPPDPTPAVRGRRRPRWIVLTVSADTLEALRERSQPFHR